jgi:hypothetical protein
VTGFVAIAMLVTAVGVPFIIAFSREPEPENSTTTLDAKRDSRGVWSIT